MSKRENFTAERVAGFKCEPGKQQSIYWDGKAPGLGLRVTMAGAKSYIFETRLHGKSLRQTIGDVRTWTIGKAQAEATRLKTLTDQGIDPRQEKAERAAADDAKRDEAMRQRVTVAEVWAAYIEARRHKWSVRHLADHNALADAGGDKRQRADCLTEPGALAALMPLRLAEIDAECIKAWLRDETAKRPTQASLAYRLLRAFLNWCTDMPDYRGIAAADACHARIAKDILPKKSAKSDCLQREQLPAWFAAVRTTNNPVIAAYLQALLLTGARREELAWLKWDDVDFRWNSLTIRDKAESKGGEEGQRMIPLTPYVSSLLTMLPRRNEWVFSSPTAAAGRLMEPRLAHNKVLTATGLPALTLHGLRRSFGTLSEWCEVPTGVVAQIMGHKPSATAEKHYRVRPLDLLRMWHTKIEGWILDQADIAQPAENAQGLHVVAGNSKKAIL